MTQITLTVENGEALVSKFREATLAVEKLPKKEIREEVEAAMEAARTYPPELPKQKYVRTYTYFRSFRIKPAGKGYSLTSRATQKGREYTKYVGADAKGLGQAKIHVGRWPIIKYEMSRAVERVRLRAEEALRKIFEKGPGGL